MTVAFRAATSDDHVFVISNWVASFRTAHAAGIIPMDTWHEDAWKIFERYIARAHARTLVAEEDGTLYGFLSFEGPAPRARWRPNSGASRLDGLPYVYYAYTKEYRRRGRATFGVGIMSGLLDAAGIPPKGEFGYFCKTASVVHLMDAGKIPGARWDPLRARYEREAPR